MVDVYKMSLSSLFPFFKNIFIYLAVPGLSLIAQLEKNTPAMQETLVQFLSWEDLLEKG